MLPQRIAQQLHEQGEPQKIFVTPAAMSLEDPVQEHRLQQVALQGKNRIRQRHPLEDLLDEAIARRHPIDKHDILGIVHGSTIRWREQKRTRTVYCSWPMRNRPAARAKILPPECERLCNS